MNRSHPHYKKQRCLNWLFRKFYLDSGVAWWVKLLCYALSVTVPALVTLLEFCDPDGQDLLPVIKPVVSWLHKNRLSIVLILLVLQFVVGLTLIAVHYLTKFDRKKLKNILDFSVTTQFDPQNREKFHYRATLFKLRACVFCGKWFGIVCRSGQNYHNSNTIFSYNSHRKDECTGIVGETARQEANLIKVLQVDEANYNSDGFVCQVEREHLNVSATVFYSTPIYNSGGDLWGILILDTNDTNSHNPSAQNKAKITGLMKSWSLAVSAAIT